MPLSSTARGGAAHARLGHPHGAAGAPPGDAGGRFLRSEHTPGWRTRPTHSALAWGRVWFSLRAFLRWLRGPAPGGRGKPRHGAPAAVGRVGTKRSLCPLRGRVRSRLGRWGAESLLLSCSAARSPSRGFGLPLPCTPAHPPWTAAASQSFPSPVCTPGWLLPSKAAATLPAEQIEQEGSLRASGPGPPPASRPDWPVQ